MNISNRKYSSRKIAVALVFFVSISFSIFAVFRTTTKGKTEDKVAVPVLTKKENTILRRFNNDYHLELAKKKGLKKPLTSQKEHKMNANAFSSQYGLDEITDNKYYEIPHLTNSLPYLKPAAKDFLELLGEKFCDRLDELGMTKYRFSVTSILRTLEDQKSLRKNNVNATPNNSSHYYGRTFDISQTRFFERGESTPVYSYRLRNLLLRVLIEMQNEGLCYVLLESQTKCIHVTVK